MELVKNDPPPEAAVEPKPETVLYYQPLPGDPAETTVHDVKFSAYEATTIHENRKWLADKLVSNPWFGSEINKERHEKWDPPKDGDKE